MLAKYYDSMMKTPDLFDTLRLFEDFYGTSWTSRSKESASTIYRVEADGDALNLSIDLPGVKSKDLNVQMVGRDVKISGKLREKDFLYTYRITRDYDPETICASLEDGVLLLTFQKTQQSTTRTIEIKTK